MWFLYHFFIRLLIFGMRIGSLFNTKIKKGWEGRKETLSRIKEKISKNDKVIWLHSASLGEYEQGLPVLEKLKEKYPNHKILISFFSPSGYENVIKKPHIADIIFYLPFDTPKVIKQLTDLFHTDIFIIVKYDFWFFLLNMLKQKGAYIYIISANFYANQIFFKPFGKWFVNNLRQNIDWIFHQTKQSETIAKSIGLKQSSTSGDTRFDRVKQILERDNTIPNITKFKDNKTTIIFGSSWETEEKIAYKIAQLYPNIKIIIAPHDLKRSEKIKQIFKNNLVEITDKNTEITNYNAQILLINCIGLLSKLYSYADIAIVGGGFHSAGLHNILEASAFGIPVIFGNHYKKNPEADSLILFGGAKSFADEKDTIHFISQLIENKQIINSMGEKSKKFIQQQPNATEFIVNHIIN